MSQAAELAYGAAAYPDGQRTVVARSADRVVDLGRWAAQSAETPTAIRQALSGSDLGPLLSSGRPTWEAVHHAVGELLASGGGPDAGEVRSVMPFEVADFVDFYASRHHTENVGRIFRPSSPPLPEAWLSIPIGYHGRAGSVVVSGTPVRRPHGVIRGAAGPVFAPSAKLDVEAEIGFVVGTPSVLGEPVAVEDFQDHVFGVCVVNDWSARDVQSFEYVPLGPFLGKSFATTISAWVTPLPVLEQARVPAAGDELPGPATYLQGAPRWGLDIGLEVEVNGEVLSRPSYAHMHWSAPQMLAHLTVNGAPLRSGDLYASGTVSGPTAAEYGSLLELSHDATRPLTTSFGPRGYLADSDEVVIRAWARRSDGIEIPLHEAAGTVLAACPASIGAAAEATMSRSS